MAPEREKSGDLIKHLWLSNQEPEIKMILATFPDKSLEDLAATAESMWQASNDARDTSVNNIANNSTDMEELKEQILKLTKTVEELKSSQQRQTFNHQTHHQQGKYSQQTDNLCYFHKKFGREARKCEPSCRYFKNLKSPKNFIGDM